MPEELELTRQELQEIATALQLRRDMLTQAGRRSIEPTLAAMEKVAAILTHMGTCESVGIK